MSIRRVAVRRSAREPETFNRCRRAILALFYRTKGHGPAWTRLRLMLDVAVPLSDADWIRITNGSDWLLVRAKSKGSRLAVIWVIAAALALVFVNIDNNEVPNDALDMLGYDYVCSDLRL